MEIVAAEAKHKAELVKRRVEALKDRVDPSCQRSADRLKYANGILRALDLYAGASEEIRTLGWRTGTGRYANHGSSAC